MHRALASHIHLDSEMFKRTSLDLERLTARLPADAVQSLANEVVERLSSGNWSGKEQTSFPPFERIEQLTSALLSSDPDSAADMICEISAEGTSVADIYLLYLAAAARRLGEKWAGDEATFLEVSIGASRILAIMRGLREAFRSRRPAQERAALFVAVPGEQHTVGVTMAADLFRNEGWDIALLIGASHDEILEAVGKTDASVVGLTAHGTQSLDALLRLILAIRVVNPVIDVLVSGHIVDEAEDVLALTGADGFANDVPTALIAMQRMHDLARRTEG